MAVQVVLVLSVRCLDAIPTFVITVTSTGIQIRPVMQLVLNDHLTCALLQLATATNLVHKVDLISDELVNKFVSVGLL